MKCPSGKRAYPTKERAEEVLVETKIKFRNPMEIGPVNVYECQDCGNFHLTSQGEISDVLKSDKIKKEIDREREARHWERKRW